jgi:hypothetical protein
MIGGGDYENLKNAVLSFKYTLNKQKMKKILLAVLVLGLIGGGYGYYLFNKPVGSTSDKKANLAIDATALYKAFQADEAKANEAYVGKVVAVSGEVQEARTLDGITKVTLVVKNGPGVLCEFETNASAGTIKPFDKISIKGECAGADLDGTILISRCVMIKE